MDERYKGVPPETMNGTNMTPYTLIHFFHFQFLLLLYFFLVGLRQQCNEIPLRFFIDQLNQNKNIIFTGIYKDNSFYCFVTKFIHFDVGFSFGAMLACCVCVRLWKSTTKQEVLLKRAACITFGQPLLKIKMVEEEIRVCPQFEKSIHSIHSVDDCVPLMISCVEFLVRHPPIIPRLGDFHSKPVSI